jgi:hypothetical protein
MKSMKRASLMANSKLVVMGMTVLLCGSASVVGMNSAIAKELSKKKSAADALMDVIPGDNAQEIEEKAIENEALKTEVSEGIGADLIKSFKLDDPFVTELFSVWRLNQSSLGFDHNQWVMRVLRGETEKAMHLWTVIEKSVPEKFRVQAKAIWIYGLFRLGLDQSFLTEWLKAMKEEKFIQQPLQTALERLVAPEMQNLVMRSKAFLDPQEIEQVWTIPKKRGTYVLELQAVSALRNSKRALEILPLLPKNHPLKVELAQTATLDAVKRKDLAGAGRILKRELEPALEAKGQADLLAVHYLQVARLLYQAQALEAAEVYYSKIPAKSPYFLRLEKNSCGSRYARVISSD